MHMNINITEGRFKENQACGEGIGEQGGFSGEKELSALREYFLGASHKLMQPACGVLQHPFLSPGGIYREQLWDWDSFFMNRGLLALREDAGAVLAQQILDCGTGSWLNFFLHQGESGAIPILMTSDNADAFSCCQDGGIEKNQAKPVFAQFALDLVTAGVPVETFRPHLGSLRRFHRHWKRKYGAVNGLLTWGSDVAIGMDNDPTSYGRPEFSSANLLLNCLYHADLTAAATLGKLGGDSLVLEESQADAEALGSAIASEAWDERDGFYYTVDVQCEDMRDRYIPAEFARGMDMSWKSLPLKIQTFSGFLPIGTGISTPDRNQKLVARHFSNPRTFNAKYGVRSISADEKMYCPERESANPSNWLGPIWIVANYLVWQSLKNAGFDTEAAQLAGKTLRLLHGDLQKTGTLHECYHPDTGAPNFNADFLSWNILSLLMKP